MNVAVLTHFYPPEPCAAATRVASLVEALANRGHHVTVVTNFASFPGGRFSPKDRWKLGRVKDGGRVKTVRLFSLVLSRMPGRRLVHWLSSAVASTIYLLTTRARFDTIVVSSPPVTLGVPALIGSWRHRARLVVDIRDVFPDIAIAMGAWSKNGFPARATEWLVRRLYRRANLVVAVTPTAIEQVASRGISRSKLLLARNAAQETPEVLAHRNGNGFTAIYAGNLGIATDVDLIVDAAAMLAADGITFEVVGDGAQRAHLDERIVAERLRNIVVRGSMPRLEALQHVAGADVSIVPLRKGIEESVPTKLYDSLALGCPVVVAAGGEASSEGTELGAFCTPAGDAGALATTLRRLRALDPKELRDLGLAGRDRIRSRTDRAGIMAEMAARIESLA